MMFEALQTYLSLEGFRLLSLYQHSDGKWHIQLYKDTFDGVGHAPDPLAALGLAALDHKRKQEDFLLLCKRQSLPRRSPKDILASLGL